MSGIYQKQTNSGSVASPSAGRTLISVNESGELFTKESSGAVTVYGSGSGGGGGAAFPFTGSADISGTLNVDFTDSLSFITNDNVLFPEVVKVPDGVGGWVDISFSGSVLGSIVTGSFTAASSSFVLRNYIGDGDTIIPGIASFPTHVAAQTLNIPHYSGSVAFSSSIFNRTTRAYDQTAIGGGVAGTIADELTWTADDGTIHQFSTAFIGDDNGTWDVQKINNAGETIQLSLEAQNTGFVLSTDIADTSASLLSIEDQNGQEVMGFSNNGITSTKISLLNYADDDAAEAGGVPPYGIYHDSGSLRIRLTGGGPP
jgi:hypothetical protein